jgi:hypothetical protein
VLLPALVRWLMMREKEAVAEVPLEAV